MGYHIHHSIVVTSWDKTHLTRVHDKAVKMFGGIVSEITSALMNGHLSFFIAPDGSKERWSDSDEMDVKRKEFKTWMKKTNSFCDWVELSFGGDEPESNTEIIEFGNYVEMD